MIAQTFAAIGLYGCAIIALSVWVYVCCAVAERLEKDWKARRITDIGEYPNNKKKKDKPSCGHGF